MERENSRVSFGPESSINTGPVNEDLSRGPEAESDEDEPPSVFHVSDVVEVCFIFLNITEYRYGKLLIARLNTVLLRAYSCP